MNLIEKFKKYKNQILAACGILIIAISHGILLGWNSPSTLLLLSEDSPLSTGRITIEESSWLGSIYSLGSIVGNIAMGFCGNILGRKVSLIILSFPQLIFWILVYFGGTIDYLYVARFLGGFGGGGLFVIAPVFLTEISNTEIRGSLSSSFILAVNFGILLGFIICGNVAYYIVPIVFFVLPIIFFFIILLFPETPQYLLTKKNETKSKESLQFYKSSEKYKIEEIFNEMKFNLTGSTDESKISLSDFVTKDAKTGLMQSFIIGMIYSTCGCFIVMNYAGSIFIETGSKLDPNISSIIFGVVQTVAGYISTVICDHITRRKLLMMSAGGGALGYILTGIFVLLIQFYPDEMIDFDWLPVVTLCFTMFTLTIGIVPFSHVVMAEMLPQKIKQISFAFTNCVMNTTIFVLLKVYPILLIDIGLFSVMIIFGSICLLALLFFGIYLVETSKKFV